MDLRVGDFKILARPMRLCTREHSIIRYAFFGSLAAEWKSVPVILRGGRNCL